jgi:hypothetical protein
MSMRSLTQDFQKPASTLPAFDPGNFVSVIDNPHYPLRPGTTYFNASPEGFFVDNLTATRDTIEILGVTCVVVEDLAYEGGELVERTLDYFAQDKQGNVWYLGEDSTHFEDGKPVSTEGSWRAGTGNQHAGIIMLADPQIGDFYKQEQAPGVAEDQAVVISLNASVNVPYGSFSDLLQTDDTTPLEPGFLEKKFYAEGIGLLQEIPNDGPQVDLLKIRFQGTARADDIDGYAGRDELFGLQGNDQLDGGGGSDTIKGGRGADVISGGNDSVADLLHGNQGDDRISLHEGDKGYGGDGNDRLRLFDNEDFGLIDGGGQNGTNLGKGRGDILLFEGSLDLTMGGVSERITHIETLSMVGAGSDRLTLSAQDVLDLGEGRLDPAFCRKDKWGSGDAMRVEGGDGDHLTLTGGKWREVDNVTNVPDNYDVFARQTSTGTAYVIVDEDIQVHLA